MNTYKLTDADREILKVFLEKRGIYDLVFDESGKPALSQTAGKAPIRLKDGLPWALGWVYFNSLDQNFAEEERLASLAAWARRIGGANE